ncbi:SMI1/KNR4 family protein [Streptomyces sp. CNZ748]|uniref:SMI1/KNR4 family protein n=1 Tax=Streptomyces sp. CNZ748 TaxID=2885160 RepID=UPI001E578E8A|nr:SMI1/KNR4 family protein [Streptomyces sp. CNZ748]
MMNAIQASEQLIELIHRNDDIANYADGCDAETITAAESTLGFPFPPSYRRLIEEFGTWDIAGEDFLGVYTTPAMGSELLGSVAETLDARNQYGMPHNLIVIMFDGMGGLVALDSSHVDQQGEYPVVVWNPGVMRSEDMERLGDAFGPFAYGQCQRAVTMLRGI